MDLIKQKNNLPVDLKELKNILLIGREKYNLYQRKLSYINKTGELASERKQLLEDGILLGELLLYAESKIGSLLKETNFKSNQHGGSTDGTTTLKDLGFSKTDSSRFQKISDYKYLIDNLIDDCRKRNILPTRKDLLDRIKTVQHTEHLNQFKTKSKNFNPLENLTVINDDFNNTLLENIDLILCDPPYIKEYLHVYSELRDYAEKVLKPSGFCIFYINPEILNHVITTFSKSNKLKYIWTISLLHTGSTGVFHPKRIYCNWKPILIYQKEPYTTQESYFKDVIEGTGREKSLHPWQQSTGELESIIDTFSNTYDTILDPFAGSGSTGIQSLRQGRKSILIEKDKETFKILKSRFTEELNLETT